MDYAQMIVDKLGLTDHVTVIPKNGYWLNDLKGPAAKEEQMDIAFDDVEVGLATVNVKVKREPRDEFTDTENPLGKIYSNK